MSSVFSGYPVQTKPGKPRMDQSRPGDPDSQATPNYQFHYYRDINGAGAIQPTASFAIGDNVDLTNPQSIHSTMKYLLDFSRENALLLVRPIGANKECYVISLAVGGTKVNTTVLGLPVNNVCQEADLDQDAINYVIYLFGPDSPSALATGAGIFYSMSRRLIELARESGYTTVGEPRRLAGDIDDETDNVGGEVTFIAPTWSTAPPFTVPDVIEWDVNGVVIPGSDGSADLLVENLTLAQNGDIYRVRAGYFSPGKTYPDAWKHSGAGILTVTDN